MVNSTRLNDGAHDRGQPLDQFRIVASVAHAITKRFGKSRIVEDPDLPRRKNHDDDDPIFGHDFADRRRQPLE
jgi:hypothetical protein